MTIGMNNYQTPISNVLTCHIFHVYYSSHVATSLRAKEAGEDSQESAAATAGKFKFWKVFKSLLKLRSAPRAPHIYWGNFVEIVLIPVWCMTLD
jgi:hypothetical protein